MPKPGKNEKKGDFISRCIKQLVTEENKEVEQATGQCYGIWEQHEKEKQKAE